MDSNIIAAIIGASATIGSVITAFLLNQFARKISDKKFRRKHNIRDISGMWVTKWEFTDENDEEIIIESTNHIEMKGKNGFQGEGKADKKKWHYSLSGKIDEMGYLSGTWDSLVDSYKGSFLLKLRPNLKVIEGHVVSIAVKTDTDTRSGKWIWEFKER